jgi:hypothetical protein
MQKSQSLFNLTTALHVSGVTITHLQENKTTVTTASGNRYATHNTLKPVPTLPRQQQTPVWCNGYQIAADNSTV